jgi:hypothetical protein
VLPQACPLPQNHGFVFATFTKIVGISHLGWIVAHEPFQNCRGAPEMIRTLTGLLRVVTHLRACL